MENNEKEKEKDKNYEKNEQDNKELNNIEPIETLQYSHKNNQNYKNKNFHQNKNSYFHPKYFQNNFSNNTTMGKNRINYNQNNYKNNTNNEIKNKNYNYKKKRNQDLSHNNEHNNTFNDNKNDNKLNFIYKYKEAEDFSNYESEFSKFSNLNFLKQNWKQKNFIDDTEMMGGLGLNIMGQNQQLNNNNYSSLHKTNFNQSLNSFNLGNNNMNNNLIYMINLLNNSKLVGGKQNMNNMHNMQNNVASPNKAPKLNNSMINSLINFPINHLNLNNNNMNNMANMNQSKLNGINSMNNQINNIMMIMNQINNNNNKYKPILRNQQQVPQSPNNDNTANKNNQDMSHINNMNNVNQFHNSKNSLYMNNQTNNNVSNQISNSFNSLIQFYFNTLQCQQIILNKMTQLLNSNNNPNIHTEIQNTVNQLKTMLNNEMSQISPIISPNNINPQVNNSNTSTNNTSINNNSINLGNNNININKDNNENKEKMSGNDNNDKYIQNFLSTWPKQKFIKPYSPLLKLEKTSSLKSNNFISNPLNANNTLNINTISYPNLNSNDINRNYILNNESEFNKQLENNYNDQQIEELLKVGKCLTGVIRINKLQNYGHGYITVPGINNDILIRGKNLYQCLNLDEVVVELFNFNQWKSLANKRTKNFSHVNEECLLNNVANSLINDENKNQIQNTKSLDEEENNLKTKEDRLNYINTKLYDLRPEGRVVRILKSPNKEREQICTIQIEKNKILAVPIDDNIPKILINIRKKDKDNQDCKYFLTYFPNEFDRDFNNYKKKYFYVKIHSFGSSSTHKGPLGYIVNEIGEFGDLNVETEVLLNRFHVYHNDNFSDEIMKDVYKKLNEIKITDEYIKNTKRQDFRNELVFTIDPYTSKDLDDAIHVKVIDEETKLLEVGVHIADPTTYVEKDSPLDQEALNRATSVYLVQKKISMLPLILSEDICSIMPHKDTLTISCIFRIHLNSGTLDPNFRPYFCLSVVNSRAKWNYDLVQNIIEGKEVNYNDLKAEDGTKPDSEKTFNDLKYSVQILHKLTQLVRKTRFESGSLMIDNDDIYFDLDKEKNLPKSFHIEVKNESHNLIEELMLISNYLCAHYINENLKEYSLLRRHPFFNDNKVNEIQRYFTINKMSQLDFEDPRKINQFLINTKKDNYNKYICIQHKLKFFILRAEYVFQGKFSQDELKHSSLNLDLYTHFTSPIRRYPDIIVHRQLKEIFRFQNKEIDESSFKEFEVYKPSIDHINDRYNSAKLISQKSRRIYQCLYIKIAPKKMYTALIMDIISKNNTKKGANNTNNANIGNNSGYANNNNEEDDIYLVLFVPEMNLELEWRKADNEEIVLQKYEKNKNYLYIDYMVNSECKNKYLRAFDELSVELHFIDYTPIDVKCKIDLTK